MTTPEKKTASVTSCRVRSLRSHRCHRQGLRTAVSHRPWCCSLAYAVLARRGRGIWLLHNWHFCRAL